MKRASLLAAFALLVVIAGCGSGSQSSSDKSGPALVEMPSPKKPIADEVAGFERALKEESCTAFLALFFPTLKAGEARPANATTPGECTEEGSLVRVYARRIYRPITDSREYGTAALMEMHELGSLETYTFWVIDGGGHFRFINFEVAVDPQFGTEFAHRGEAEHVAEDFVHAVKTHDCKALLGTLEETSRLIARVEGPQATCRAVLDGAYFAPAIHATPNPKIEVMGGTKAFAFIGVPTTSAYFTLVMGQNGSRKLRVVDVLPSTPLKPAGGATPTAGV